METFTVRDGVLLRYDGPARGKSVPSRNNPCGIRDVMVPPGVKTIGVRAFQGCKGMMNVTLPEGVEAIADEAFSDCAGLYSLRLPDSVKKIGARAFSNCVSLRKLRLPEGSCDTAADAFAGCRALTDENGAPFSSCGGPATEENTEVRE